jgi:fatty acid desaturase
MRSERHMPFALRPGLTAWLGTTLLLGAASSAVAWHAGRVSLAVHVLTAATMLYFLFICVHDGVHRVLLRHQGANDALATVLAACAVLPFPLLRSAHLRHHQTVGRPSDPEAVIYDAAPLRLLLRLPLVPLYYLRELRYLSSGARLGIAAHCAAWMALAALGGEALALGWLLPVGVAMVWFGFTTVYVPHCANRRRLMRYFNFHSGYHDDHHRDPRYPFHQYFQLRLNGLERLGLAPSWRYERAALRLACTDLRALPGRLTDALTRPHRRGTKSIKSGRFQEL